MSPTLDDFYFLVAKVINNSPKLYLVFVKNKTLQGVSGIYRKR